MEAIRLRQLRALLFGLAALLFAGSIVELLAVKHYGETIRLVPFALCILGLIAIAAVWLKPAKRTVFVFRVLMLVIAGGSLLGVYEHIEGNYEFFREIHPKASISEQIKATFHGRDPLMAPGMLAFGAALGFAATYAAVSVDATELAPEARTVGLRSRPSAR